MYEDNFSADLFVNRDYKCQEFDFGILKQKLLCSHAASTDHDLTGQVVWPVSAFLAWYLVAQRDKIVGKNVVELGAGAGLSGLVASQFASHTALTDGNDIVLDLLKDNVQTNADASKVQALQLIWGDYASVKAFEYSFPYPVDMLIGADVVCWPNLVKPILQTVKYLLLRSRNSIKTKFCCGLVCRAQSTEDLFFREAAAFGFRYHRIPHDTFLPTPRPAAVASHRELQLVVLKLDPKAPNWNEPVQFADAKLLSLQTAC
ncbi:Predicted methyltransferase [Plasmopara halstedii]|uniref:Predicted methyltransferase n=1 Tax=Plasmopara halstedii TaxID=4781 RepID=A0A0P1A5Y7_PLAHL|nr:Predicted methyltransferase [Plasmopara halstedii]CEG35978.1 Predicted methyltransferase [Plasmopara halstedii]|eukprot:XP_024572347.1 Predicted methyltransferase [Plasmopara halstedii]